MTHVALRPAVASRKPRENESPWENKINAVRPDITLLAALARCDGHTVSSEVEAIINYLARMIESDGAMMTDAEIAKLDRHIARLRPTSDAIIRALQQAATYSPQRVKALLLAAAAVMDADNVRHPSEARLLNAVSTELIGVPII